MSPPSERKRRAVEGGIAVVLLALAFWAGLQIEGHTSREPFPGIRGDSTAEAPTLTVRDTSGNLVLLAGSGEPTVVMISSTTCGYCRQSLADIATIADGGSTLRLRLLTLEGIEGGREMTRSAGVSGVWHAEPSGSASAALLSLNLPGTPVFLLLDSDGRVRRTMPGYPGREGMRAWVDVMLGVSDTLAVGGQGALRRNSFGE